MDLLLDAKPMVQLLGEHWCCLLCMRQFETERKVLKHLAKSSLHAENLAPASAAGRVKQQLGRATSEKRPQDALGAVAPPAKRQATAAPAPMDPAPTGSLSALQQMELFEKRLKVQSKRLPEKEAEPAVAQTDSTHARTINGQMDWECSNCGEFNFARTVTCGQCKQHVDHTTKYIGNRLKELKQERFARFLSNDEELSARAPGHPLPPDPMRADGSCSATSASARAAFHR